VRCDERRIARGISFVPITLWCYATQLIRSRHASIDRLRQTLPETHGMSVGDSDL